MSVVVPVFNSEQTLEPLVERLHAALADRYPLEVVLVNDGSADGSAAVCRRLAQRHPWVRFVGLSRNFGEHNAVMAGLRFATGDCAVADTIEPATSAAARRGRFIRCSFVVGPDGLMSSQGGARCFALSAPRGTALL